MRYTAHYSNQYEPAMPVLELQLGSDKYGESMVLEALVDSGADATLIPKNYLMQLGAKLVEERWLRGVTGVPQLVPLYTVYLQIGQFGCYTSAVGILGAEAIVGRDVLNQFVMTLDGLSQTVIIESD